MDRVRSGDTDIYFTVRGEGQPVVLLHPFPTNHRFWDGILPHLEQRYRVIMPDLRGMGESAAGDGPATMAKHAADILAVCREAKLGKAVFGGCSIGGYILMELWRQQPERFNGMILMNTKATPDTEEARKGRYISASLILERGPAKFLDELLPKLVGESTRRNRPDLFDRARALANTAKPAGLAALLHGMAERPDSVPTLRNVRVPALIISGREDTATPEAEAAQMHQLIAGSKFVGVEAAGHYAPLEQPEAVGKLLRTFLDSIPHTQ